MYLLTESYFEVHVSDVQVRILFVCLLGYRPLEDSCMFCHTEIGHIAFYPLG